MINLLNLLTGGAVIYALIVFFAFSYGIVALLTWSPLKPLKYLGFPVILSGVLSICLKALFYINPHDMSYSSLVKLVASKGEAVFFKYGVVLLIIGVIMLGIYYMITFLKIKKGQVNDPTKEEKLV